MCDSKEQWKTICFTWTIFVFVHFFNFLVFRVHKNSFSSEAKINVTLSRYLQKTALKTGSKYNHQFRMVHDKKQILPNWSQNRIWTKLKSIDFYHQCNKVDFRIISSSSNVYVYKNVDLNAFMSRIYMPSGFRFYVFCDIFSISLFLLIRIYDKQH